MTSRLVLLECFCMNIFRNCSMIPPDPAGSPPPLPPRSSSPSSPEVLLYQVVDEHVGRVVLYHHNSGVLSARDVLIKEPLHSLSPPPTSQGRKKKGQKREEGPPLAIMDDSYLDLQNLQIVPLEAPPSSNSLQETQPFSESRVLPSAQACCPLCGRDLSSKESIYVTQNYFSMLARAKQHEETLRKLGKTRSFHSTNIPFQSRDLGRGGEGKSRRFRGSDSSGLMRGRANPFMVCTPTTFREKERAREMDSEGEEQTCPLPSRLSDSVTEFSTPHHVEAELLDAEANLQDLPVGLLNTGRDERSVYRHGSLSGYYARFFAETRKLGSGSFGSVFLCKHRIDDLVLGKYAVKKVPVGDNRDWLRRMVKEVKTLECLSHPRIVSYKHSWLELHRASPLCPFVPFLFILMEYCDAGNLETLVLPPDVTEPPLVRRRVEKNKGPSVSVLPSSSVWSLFLDVLLGLRYLHHQRILHRDVKLSNILLNINNEASPPCPFRALLSDFGTAELEEEAAHQSDITGFTGTMEFTAPEILCRSMSGREGVYNEKSDMWSLGVVLYAVCYNHLPFQSSSIDSLKEMLFAHDEQSFFLPSSPSRPSTLKDLISALVARDPRHRPNTDDLYSHEFIQNKLRSQDQPKPVWKETSSWQEGREGEGEGEGEGGLQIRSVNSEGFPRILALRRGLSELSEASGTREKMEDD